MENFMYILAKDSFNGKLYVYSCRGLFQWESSCIFLLRTLPMLKWEETKDMNNVGQTGTPHGWQKGNRQQQASVFLLIFNSFLFSFLLNSRK